MVLEGGVLNLWSDLWAVVSGTDISWVWMRV